MKNKFFIASRNNSEKNCDKKKIDCYLINVTTHSQMYTFVHTKKKKCYIVTRSMNENTNENSAKIGVSEEL